MFTTFSSTVDGKETDINSSVKPKRRQVARACTWCRTYRLRCESKIPCHNCVVKQRECTTENGRDDIRTFPSAVKEIDRLRERVKELEDQVNGLRLQSASSSSSNKDHDVPDKREEDVLPEELDPLGQHGSNRRYYNWSVATRITNQGSNQAYGASSTFYFAAQLSSYLDMAYRKTPLDQSGCKPDIRSSASSKLQSSFVGVDVAIADLSDVAEDLPRLEEERLFQMYWDYYYALCPILIKEDFEDHYRSLWKFSGKSRDPSALVDILLAFCLQHDAGEKAFSFQMDNPSRVRPTSSTVGRWFFRRSQYFLQDEIEEPTLTTFQSYAFSVLWLSQASWHNAAHNVLAATLRVGVVLGLHLEPPAHLASSVRAFKRRLWWTVYSMEAQYAMEYGRPIAVNFGQVTCTLPNDDDASEAPSNAVFILPAFNTHMISLILATRAIYILFYQECARVLRHSGRTIMSQDAEGSEACAKWLETKIGYLQAWLKQVPGRLITPRRDQGQPYSTDRSSLNMSSPDTYMPFRIHLELAYHLLAMSLYRPFISFERDAAGIYPVTERHAIACANHAITLTDIIHQGLTELGCLRTWHKLCSDQFSATLSLIGYIIAFPRGPTAVAAREAVQTATKSFDLLAGTFVRASRDSAMLQDILKQVDMLQADDRPEIPFEVQNSLIMSKHTHQGIQKTSQSQDEMASWKDLHFSVAEPAPFADSMGNEDWLDNLLNLEHTTQDEDLFIASIMELPIE